MIKKILLMVTFASLAIIEQGCFHSSHEVEVKPVEIKPMHVTVDLNVKVEKSLAEFFDEVNKRAEKISSQKKKAAAPQAVAPKTSPPMQMPASTSTQTNNDND